MRFQTIWVIILAIIFGAIAGLLGSVVIGANSLRLPFFGQLSFSDLTDTQQLIIDQPRTVVVQQDIQLRQIDNAVMPTLANVYASTTRAVTPLEHVLPSAGRLGQAVVLTTDGWLMTTSSTVANRSGAYTIVGYQSKQYALTNVTVDERTGFIFGKVDGANLPVAQLGALEDVAVGQTIVLISGRSTIQIGHITRIGYRFDTAQMAVLSSDRLAKEIYIDRSLGREQQGAVVATLKGQIVGVVNADRIIPIDYAKAAISNVLERKPITRPVMGLTYFDLSHVEGLSKYGDRGALIAGEPAVGSPAVGKVKTGDVITHIDDVELNVYRGLAEQIQQYRPGTSVELRVRRGSENLTVDVVLK